MGAAKVAISMDRKLLERLDGLVRDGLFASRSQAIQVAVREKIQRMEAGRLARECAKLDPGSEQALAEEGLAEDTSGWPRY
jgi:Arc/MetJ-type ribon-helix-helix transcriptional regulator